MNTGVLISLVIVAAVAGGLWVLDNRNAKRKHSAVLRAEVAAHDAAQAERLTRAATDADFFKRTGRLP